MDIAVSTSDLHAEGFILTENTSCSWDAPVARQANAGKMGDRKPDNSLESPLGRPNTPRKRWKNDYAKDDCVSCMTQE